MFAFLNYLPKEPKEPKEHKELNNCEWEKAYFWEQELIFEKIKWQLKFVTWSEK